MAEESIQMPPVAAFWRRVAATLFDVLFLVVATACFLACRFGLFLEDFSLPISDPNPEIFHKVVREHLLMDGGVIVGFLFFYFFLLEYLFCRGTLGKMILGIRISTLKGTRPGLLQILLRCFGKFFFGATTLGFSWLCSLLSKKRQAWHDRLARTLVLQWNAPPLTSVRSSGGTTPENENGKDTSQGRAS